MNPHTIHRINEAIDEDFCNTPPAGSMYLLPANLTDLASNAGRRIDCSRRSS
jgi:hypothetical protein